MLSLIEKVIRDNAFFEFSKYYSKLPGETPLHSVHNTGITASITVINHASLSRSTGCVMTLVAANVSGAKLRSRLCTNSCGRGTEVWCDSNHQYEKSWKIEKKKFHVPNLRLSIYVTRERCKLSSGSVTTPHPQSIKWGCHFLHSRFFHELLSFCFVKL